MLACIDESCLEENLIELMELTMQSTRPGVASKPRGRSSPVIY
jgi:hypothetical protein